MSRTFSVVAATLAIAAVACSDRPSIARPEATESAPPALPPTAIDAPTRDLARLVARALSDSAFRIYVWRSLAQSPFREHKLHLQDLLRADRSRATRAIAAVNGVSPGLIAAEAGATGDLEIYLPVPAHRAAWSGDENVLVATATRDGEAPVAFDTRGRRVLLRADAPPAVPVIAVVPAELDFAAPTARQKCMSCGGRDFGDPAATPSTPGLYLTRAHFVDDFEGWLKGNPEFEVHILGQKGQSDSLTAYQCAGEHAGGPYAFDQNGKDWSGSALLFSGAQIAAYNAAHPGQNFRVFVVEDDDAACVIKTDKDFLRDLLGAIDSEYGNLTAGNDSSTGTRKTFKRGTAFQRLWAALASVIKSNDELVGNAVEDAVVSTSYPGFNWIVKGTNSATTGWLKLEMK